MIILNPEHGAIIKNFVYKGTLYFKSEDKEEFLPGQMLEFDEEVGRFFLEHYGFLVEMEPNEAKRYSDKKVEQTFKCESCNFVSGSEDGLKKHEKSHEIEKELGLKKVQGKKVSEENIDTQKSIDDEAARDGLTEGDGLTEEKSRRKAVMR